MSKPIITQFLKIGQSGKSIDGRSIHPEWLLQMAEKYDPAVYTALIWPEHFRWAGNYGKVVELRAETDANGVVSLFARLSPNANYLWENQQGQRLFFSMEIEPNFAGTGKAYLSGLGITDSPASLGTEETRFSHRKTKPENIFIGNVEFDDTLEPQTGSDEAPSWFRRLFPALFKTDTAANPQEDNMDKEQFTALLGKIEVFSTELQALSAKVESLAQKPEPEKQPEASQFNAEAALKDMETMLLGLKDQLQGMAEKFEAAQPGTKAPTTTTPAGDTPLL